MSTTTKSKPIKNLMIVESPAKAKKIGGFLGPDYTVVASVGHIRSIAKNKTEAKGKEPIDTAHNFETVYVIDSDKKSVVRELKADVKRAENVYLASDEDREGEAIAWHLCQVLGLDPTKAKRITYTEITKSAITEALKHPRHIDMDLVYAQQARQILDRLVGFELSPVVWRKVPGGKSAGRVQSPALRLLVEREREIKDFTPEITYKTTGEFKKDSGNIKAALNKDLKCETAAKEFLEGVKGATFTVTDIEEKTAKRHPLPPYTTSTLQQDANARLGYGARTTMSIAQGLYQNGYITYMRTDSVNLSSQALAQASAYIKETYGKEYHHFRTYKTKTAGAQEAHEAIRPTDFARETVPGDSRAQKLYALIRGRALATQMADAEINRTAATIDISTRPEKFIAKGEVVIFDGFLKVYGTSKDEILPPLATGDKLAVQAITARQTFSRPPARYTEGSLVKKLTDLEIGRPSTYATIISGILTHGYAVIGEDEGTERKVQVLTLDSKGTISETTDAEKTGSNKGRLVPTDAGVVLTDFITKYFTDIDDYDFTAKVESELDEIAGKKLDKVSMLHAFYGPFHEKITESNEIKRSEVAGQRLLGNDPKDGQPIYTRMGRYGALLQKGNSEDKGVKVTFAPMPAGADMDNVTLEQALEMFKLPRSVGKTEQGEEITAAIGRFGPYIKVDKTFISIRGKASPFEITEAEARKIYTDKLAADAAKHVSQWGDIQVLNGRYGPYVTDGTKNAKIPKDTDPKSITEEQAKELLEKSPSRPRRRTTRTTRKTARKAAHKTA